MRAFRESTGHVLELGTGLYSTPLLHQLSYMSTRHLFSAEKSRGWFQGLKQYASEYHHLWRVRGEYEDEFSKLNPRGRRWGLVFIDQLPAISRRHTLIQYADVADYIIVHDTEPRVEGYYQTREILDQFKYEHTDKWIHPWTTVVSNTKDVSGW